MQKNILITRPKQDATTFLADLEKNNLNPLYLELVATKPIKPLPTSLDLNTIDIFIFVSKNAVFYFMQRFKNKTNSIKNSAIFASIGKTTALCLQGFGIKNVIYPRSDNYCSETLWERLKDIPMFAKKIAIIKGIAGRNYLTDQLAKTKATTLEYPMYERYLPQASKKEFTIIFAKHNIDLILITCETSLNNLVNLAQVNKIMLLDKTLVVISERLKKIAHSLGFSQVIVYNLHSGSTLNLKCEEYIQK